MKTTLGIISFCLLILVVAAPRQAGAWEYDKNHIISDTDLVDKSAMSLSNITSFLRKQGSGLTNYSTQYLDGTEKSAAEIIYKTSQHYKLSPKFFLTMIQKESGLVERSDVPDRLADWVLGYGVCDGCDKDDPNVVKYKGFAKQIDAAGSRVRSSYLKDLQERGYTVSGWGPGITKTTVDGVTVTPRNNATAVLYTYNPWVGAYGGGDSRWGGNSLFSLKWAEYFPGYYYPNGSLLQDEETREVFLIEDGKKFKFASLAILYINYNPDRVITVSTTALDIYESGGTIMFPNYSLLQAPSGTVFLYVDGVKRGIVSAEVLRQLGYNPQEIIQVSWADLNNIPNGPNIVRADASGGVLMQNRSNGAVFYLDADRILHPIWHRIVLTSRFRGVPISVVSPETLAKYEEGMPMKMKDGTVVASEGDPSVYVISDGYRRPIASAETFNALGYRWDQIVFVPMQVLLLHPKGGYITN